MKYPNKFHSILIIDEIEWKTNLNELRFSPFHWTASQKYENRRKEYFFYLLPNKKKTLHNYSLSYFFILNHHIFITAFISIFNLYINHS